MNEPSDRTSFSCSADGAVAAGQRRLSWMFSALGAVLLGAAAFALGTRQILAGVIALVIALGVFIIYRMSRELDLTELIVERGTLSILMRHALRRLPLEDATFRRLKESEIDHLVSLTSSGGFVAGAGGFDSHLLGEFDLYASRLENSILLETTDGRVIVTPDDPTEFLAAIDSTRP